MWHRAPTPRKPVKVRLEDRLPTWASSAGSDDLFCAGAWFEHFAATAMRPDEVPKFLQLQGFSNNGPLALALKLSRGDAVPHPRLLESMVNYYSCGYGPIATSPPGSAALNDLVDALARAGGKFDGLRIGPLDRSAEFSDALEAGLRNGGFWTFWTHAFFNWYAETSGTSYARYLQELPSSFPSTSEKRRQAFLRKATGSIVIAQTPSELHEQIRAYEQIYAASWKVPEPFPSFMPGLMHLAAERGWLRLGVLRVGAEPAAAQVWFVVDGRALIYKVAYDERFAKLSVGSMLTCALLERVIDVDRVREVDFLSGDDGYKAKWMLARRERYNLLAFNLRRWRGLTAGFREWISQRRSSIGGRPVASVNVAGAALDR